MFKQIFITGTDTNVGKTLIASWLCLHSNYDYFKPIQTGDSLDRDTVHKLSPNTIIHPEIYSYSQPVAPYLAANLAQQSILLENIKLPAERNIIIEGAGGVLVPINSKEFMLDLILWLKVPVILVARTSLGTINHSLLCINMFRSRGIEPLGVIVTGEKNDANVAAIATYGKIKVLAVLPYLQSISSVSLANIRLPIELQHICGGMAWI